MKRIACFLLIVGLLMVGLALPAAAVSETFAPDAVSADGIAVEETLTEEDDFIEIEDEDTPLAGLPGVTSADVSRVVCIAGVIMVAVAGGILAIGVRRERAHH